MLFALARRKSWKNGTKAFLRVNRYSLFFIGVGENNNIIAGIEQLYEVVKMLTQESGQVLKAPLS